MATSPKTSNLPKTSGRCGLWFGLALALLLGLLFNQVFRPNYVLFANDSPLGVLVAQSENPWSNLRGLWQDLNWLGGAHPGGILNVNFFAFASLGPVGFSKLMTPLALFALGLSAWFFFRRAGFHPWVCAVGGIAAALNGSAFSNGCWGLANWCLSRASIFLALALVLNGQPRDRWLRMALAGLAIGLAVMEGFDIGAIFSLFAGAAVLFAGWNEGGERRTLRGIRQLGVVAVFAAIMAAQALTVLIGTQVKGVAALQQLERTPQERWDWTTQWSLPKKEALRFVVSGLFGYRMDTPNGGNYWGNVGQQPGWEQHRQGFPRHSGSGEYAGVLVVLIAAWALANSFRAKGNPYTDVERRWIWFWCGLGLVALLLGFGRHAPFYRLFYALPYVSSIRNPIKFLHGVHFALVVVFGYGLQGLWRLYLARPVALSGGLKARWKQWWTQAQTAEKRWIAGSVVAVAASLLVWLIMSASRDQLMQYLNRQAFDAQQAAAIAGFSLREVGWFIWFLTLSTAAVALVMCGWFAGARAQWGITMLGLILIWDLARSDAKWIVAYDYKEKYATDPIMESLAQNPHEQRVTVLPFGGIQALNTLQQVYYVLWLQHLFPFHKIQSIDIPQEPRKAQEKLAYEQALKEAPLRLWQLTNTRYLFGLSGLIDALNQQLDPDRRRFQLRSAFSLEQTEADGPILIQTNQAGPFALIEFTGALPRARLYSNWRVSSNETAALQELASPAFNPEETVLLHEAVTTPAPAATNAPPGSVEFVSYSPKRIRLKAQTGAPAILLLNDKHHPDWKVWVDGKPAPLLRANYLVRAVHLEANSQPVEVEFRFEPRVRSLYVSAAAWMLMLILAAVYWACHRRSKPEGSRP